jgi:hypothetical protein
MVIESSSKNRTNGLLAPTCNLVAEVGIFRTMAVISHHCYYFDRASPHVLNDSYVQLRVLFMLNYSFVRSKGSPEVPKDSYNLLRSIGKILPPFLRI